MNRFLDKVVLVTGAASGIGLATARAFAREGARVVLADRAPRSLSSAVDSIRDTGGTATGINADVTEPEDCEVMVGHAVSTYGGLHIAFNNAGIASNISTDFSDASIEEWDRVLKTNVSAVFYAMKAEVPALRASGGTAIINTASIMSFLGGAGMLAYVASKHGVAGLTKAAALDLIRHGIRVNAVCPGIIDTPMLAGVPQEGRAAMAGSIPSGRLGTPEEIAEAVLFLASEEASYLVGTLLRVDGGITLP